MYREERNPYFNNIKQSVRVQQATDIGRAILRNAAHFDNRKCPKKVSLTNADQQAVPSFKTPSM